MIKRTVADRLEIAEYLLKKDLIDSQGYYHILKFIDQDDDEKTIPNFKTLPNGTVKIDDEGMIISEEEAKAIFGDMYQPKPWYDPAVTATFKPYTESPRDCSTGYHQFVRYTGLNETFFHCDKCGKKRD